MRPNWNTSFFTAGRTSPFCLLAKARSRRPLRISLPAVPRPPLSIAARAYFQTLRAAEMAAWEATGGDVVRSQRA